MVRAPVDAPSDTKDVRIRTLASGGDALGHAADGSPGTWFVPEALPGELVRVRSVRVAKKAVFAELLEVIEPSPLRRKGVSPADTCGGCDWQHIEAAAQGELKRQIVADALRELGVVPRLHELPGNGLAYRRRARMHYRKDGEAFALGFHRRKSHDIADTHRCPVLVPELQHAFDRLRSASAHLPREGEVLGLSDGKKVVLGLPGVRPEPDVLAALHECLDATLVGIELRGGRKAATIGKPRLLLDGRDGLVPVEASPFVFAQAQVEGNRALVKHVLGRAKADSLRVLELFCGNGNFTRALARNAQRVYALDDDREAIGALRRIAEQHELPINAKHSDVDKLLPKIAEGETRYDIVVADPPRQGLGQATAAAVAEVATQRIVVVACDAATLARDLKVLVGKGWSIADVTVFDMMPMTPEVEVVATLVKTPPPKTR
jgi:23S rRNA (uracil1939-C5)-methyltransferase